jgi:hypothetical protein
MQLAEELDWKGLTSWSPKSLSVPVWGLLFTSAEDYCLFTCDTLPPVRSLPSCWRNGSIHIQSTRLYCVEENFRFTTHFLLALSLLQACPLHSFLLSPYILPPITLFCPPPQILSSPLFLYYNNHAVQTLTQIPILPPTHSRPAFTFCLLHNPWLCYPYLTSLTIVCHPVYSSVIVTEVGSSSKMVVKWLLPSTFICTHRWYWYVI